MRSTIMNVWAVALAGSVALAGCGGTKASGGGSQTANSEKKKMTPAQQAASDDDNANDNGEGKPAPKSGKPAAPPPDDAAIAKAKAEQAAAAKEGASEKDRAKYDAAVKKYEAAKAAGPITSANCKGLADAFQSVGSSKTLGADAHFSAGVILDNCGMRQDAEAEYKTALQINPAHAGALNNIGEGYFRKGDRSGAKTWFDKAVQADPTHASSGYANQGLLLYLEAKEKGQPALYKEAIGKLRRALAIDAYSMPPYATLALIYYTTAENDKSKLQLAELICKQAKETNAKFAPIYNTLGLIQLRRKNVSAALREFEKAVELDPQFVEAHLNIGAIGLSARQYEKAQASFEAVLKLQPNNFDATMGLGVAMRGQRKLDEAEKYYKKAGELDPKSCSPAYNTGLLYGEYNYKADPATNSHLKTAQQLFNQFASCSKDKDRVKDAQRRVKDIDDTFKAIEEQKKIEEENRKIMEEMQKQQAAQQAAQPQAGSAPADAKPAEAKPADAKPADKPAEKAPEKK